MHALRNLPLHIDGLSTSVNASLYMSEFTLAILTFSTSSLQVLFVQSAEGNSKSIFLALLVERFSYLPRERASFVVVQ